MTSEIPYELEEDVDAAGIQNVEFIQLQGADEFPPVNYSNLTDAENAALEARLGPAKMVGRLGWLRNHAIHTRAGTLPPFSTEENAPADQLYYITDAAGNRITAPDGEVLQFTKIFADPVRVATEGRAQDENPPDALRGLLIGSELQVGGSQPRRLSGTAPRPGAASRRPRAIAASPSARGVPSFRARLHAWRTWYRADCWSSSASAPRTARP